MAKTLHVNDMRRNPVYIEECGNCTHVQAYHIQTEGPFLNGKMCACRFPDCGSKCQKWEPTWGVK